MPTLAKPRYASVLKPRVAPWAICRHCDGRIRQHRAAGTLAAAWRHIPSGARSCPPPDTGTEVHPS